MGRKTIWIILAAVVLCMAVIYFFSDQPAQTSLSLSGQLITSMVALLVPSFDHLPQDQKNAIIAACQDFVRKTAHICVYFVLGILCMLLLKKLLRSNSLQFMISIWICTAYAATDEIHQIFVAGRTASFTDVVIDLVGALAGILLIILATRKKTTFAKP